MLWVIALLNYLDRLLITSMREPLKADIAMTDAQFGLLTSVFLWVYGFFSPIGGFLADRFSRRIVIIASLFVWSVVTWVTGYTRSLEGLLVARALMGLSEACYIPAALALIADFHPGSTRSLATGLHMSGIYAGAALGGVGGVIAEHLGWRVGFQWFGLFGVGYAIITIFFLADAKRWTAEPGVAPGKAPVRLNAVAALGGLFRQPAFIALLFVNALVGTANWGIYGWLPTYLRDHFKLGLGAAGMTATGYIQVASFLGVLVGGVWADRWSRTQPRARALVPAIGMCVVAPCLYFSITADLLLVAIGGLIVFGLGRGFVDANLMPTLRMVADERLSATGYGLLNLVGVTIGGVLIYVGGWLKDGGVGLARIFQISAAGLLVAGLLLCALRPRATPPVQIQRK
jgi:MFS family permease